MWMTPTVGESPALSTELTAVPFQSITALRGAERREAASSVVAESISPATLAVPVPDALQPEAANAATSIAVARVWADIIDSPSLHRAHRAHVHRRRVMAGARSQCQCRDPRHCLLRRCVCSGRRHRRTRLQVTLRNRRAG